MKEPAKEDKLRPGQFLIAAPDYFQEGFFVRSVVLLCEHTSNSSFGLVINKPLDVDLPDELTGIQHWLNPRVFFRAGGPVKPNQLMLLHAGRKGSAAPEKSLQICEGVLLGGDLQFLHEVVSDENGSTILLCFGFASWGVGQLLSEYYRGDWLVQPARADLIFQTPPEKLWQQILLEMGGKYASLSTLPEDLSVN